MYILKITNKLRNTSGMLRKRARKLDRRNAARGHRKAVRNQ